MLHSEVSEGYHAYNVARHRHLAEFDQEFAGAAGRRVEVTFVPHLLPQNRGILATIYVRGEAEAIHAALARGLRGEPFLVVLPLGEAPATRHVRGSNFVHLGVVPDRRPGRAMVFSALDNLVKGSSGQAIQNANLMLGLPETHGADGGPAVSVTALKRFFRVLWDAFNGFNGLNDGWSMAGFIAFSGLLSLFPFLIFAATLIGIVFGETRSESIIEALFQIAPEHVALTLEPVVEEVLDKRVERGAVALGALRDLGGVERGRGAPDRLRPRLPGARPAQLLPEPGAGDRAGLPRRVRGGAARRLDHPEPADPQPRAGDRAACSCRSWPARSSYGFGVLVFVGFVFVMHRVLPGRQRGARPALARGAGDDAALGGARHRLLDLSQLHAELHRHLWHAGRGHHHADVLLPDRRHDYIRRGGQRGAQPAGGARARRREGADAEAAWRSD